MSSIEELLRALTILLVMIVIIATALGQGLLPVSLFRVTRSAMIGREGRVRLIKAWATML